jgi:hypothetical protein
VSRGRLAALLLSAAGLGLGTSPALAFQPGGNAEGSAAAPARSIETPADRFGAAAGEQIQFSAGTEDEMVTFRAELPTGSAVPLRFSLVGSVPLNNDDDAMPTSLDSLANGSKLTLRIGHFGLGAAIPDTVAEGIATNAVAACKADPENAAPARQDRCEETNYATRTYARSRYREYLWHTVPRGATDWGLDLSLGINEFLWTDPVTFGPQKSQEVDWSVTANVAHYFPGFVFSASASYQSAYEAAAEQQLCPPNAACVTARAAAPTRNEHFVLSAGFRYRFVGGDGQLARLAIAPQVNYDFEDDVWAVDVPIYFIPGPNGGLNGGVRLGYRSDRDNEFSVGLFIGTTFSLLGS